MKRLFLIVVTVSLAICVAGCKKSAATPDNEIRTAIQTHLSQKGTLNLQAFDTVVKQVTIQGDRAQADVEFHIKNGPGMMQLTYALQKNGEHWTVIESNPVNADFSHPSLDASHSPSAGAQGASSDPVVSDAVRNLKMGGSSGSASLPPGHPSVTSNPPPPTQ